MSSSRAGSHAVTVLLAVLTWIVAYLVFALLIGVVAVVTVDALVAAETATRDSIVAVAVGLGMVGCTALAAHVAGRRGDDRPWWLLALPVALGLWGVVEAWTDPVHPWWTAVLALALAVAGSVTVIARRSPASGRSPRSSTSSRAWRRSG